MGMYTFKIPMQFDKTFLTIHPGGSHRHLINLSQASYNRMDNCSIHAIASDIVHVRTWMANLHSLPFNQSTLGYNWDTPAPSEVGDLWVPCPSIPEFDVVKDVNLFQQFEFVDVCTFLMFEFTATTNSTVPVAFSLSLCFK